MLICMPGVIQQQNTRLTFDWYAQWGLKLLPVLIGVFAVSQIIKDALDIGQVPERIAMSSKGMLMSVGDFMQQGVNLFAHP